MRVDDTWSIGIDYLEIVAVDQPHDAVPCRLCLAGDDAQFFADKGIHQCRFAHIGIAYDVDEAGFMRWLIHD